MCPVCFVTDVGGCTIRFVLFFFESVHTNCVQTQLPTPRRPNLVPGAPSAHRPLIESPRRAVRVPLCQGREAPSEARETLTRAERVNNFETLASCI